MEGVMEGSPAENLWQLIEIILGVLLDILQIIFGLF
tara:strand:- start:4 stop:111 length:108 start_codon:yes stop_codon:yes gene_type:complete